MLAFVSQLRKELVGNKAALLLLRHYPLAERHYKEQAIGVFGPHQLRSRYPV
jgi:hypothetical protein